MIPNITWVPDESALCHFVKETNLLFLKIETWPKAKRHCGKGEVLTMIIIIHLSSRN